MNLQEERNRIKEMMGLISEEKESGAKWIKCRNCKKKYTQTIHKGKKSALICPHCGTHNIEETEELDESKGWGNSPDILSKEYKFENFQDAIDFINQVAKIAEKQNHHPDIQINYNKVKLSITDHEKGGVSEKCHKFVDAVDKLNTSSKKTETNEGELTEKCWTGYTQKGMKTMFGKRYPNCVKKKKQ